MSDAHTITDNERISQAAREHGRQVATIDLHIVKAIADLRVALPYATDKQLVNYFYPAISRLRSALAELHKEEMS